MIRKKLRSSYRTQRVTKSYSIGGTFEKALTVGYEVNTDHLIQITNTDLIRWEKNWPYKKPYSSDYSQYALDELYNLIKK